MGASKFFEVAFGGINLLLRAKVSSPIRAGYKSVSFVEPTFDNKLMKTMTIPDSKYYSPSKLSHTHSMSMTHIPTSKKPPLAPPSPTKILRAPVLIELSEPSVIPELNKS